MREPLKQRIKSVLRRVVPLSYRKRLCILLNRREWIPLRYRYWWTQELLRDLAASDRSGYHRFLWSAHLAYALTYDVASRFGAANMKESRKLFFADLQNHLRAQGIDPATGVRSALEVGCSLGYQLRYLETALFSAAIELAGFDIDRQAIAQGTEYLQQLGSKVVLRCADMGNLPALLEGKKFDVIVCTGVLLYLDATEAMAVVRAMLQHCGIMLALSGPAYSQHDNAALEKTRLRAVDGVTIHNLDGLVKAAGGSILGRRWEGDREIDGHTIYFVFAGPGGQPTEDRARPSSLESHSLAPGSSG
jgi:SAM-dependent methyltransferase